MAAQKMMLYSIGDWDRYKAYAKRAAGIPTDYPAVRDLPPELMSEYRKIVKFNLGADRRI